MSVALLCQNCAETGEYVCLPGGALVLGLGGR
jgi:hypothetical protein